MTRIFIEDQELDIRNDFSQQITYAVDDITNTDSKLTSFSKTIVLPGTAKNNRLLGNIFEFSNSNFTVNTAPNVGYNFNASKSAKARLEINGLQVMKGVMRLLEVIIDGEWIEYEVALFGELGGFYSAMAARKLNDLDFSDYNHDYTVANITASWDDASGGTGYYYPLIDYGTTSPNNDVNFQKKNFFFTAFRPAFFVKEYMEKIIEQAGYTFTSSFFNTAFFKRLIVPNNQNRLAYIKAALFNGKPTFSYQPVTTSVTLIPFQSYQSDSFNDTSNEIFDYTKADTLSAVFNVSFNGNFRCYTDEPTDPTDFELYFRIKLIKQSFIGEELLWESEEIGGRCQGFTLQTPRSTAFFVLQRSISASFALTNTFEFRIELTRIVNDPGIGGKIEATINPNISNVSINLLTGQLESAVYGDFLFVNGTLPTNILQKDFFSSVLKLFNLMVTEDKEKERHLVIEPYVDFYDTNRTSYLDWSDKVDRSKPIKIKPMSEVNARYYQFKFKQDNDYLNEEYRKKYNEGYGDRIYDNALEFAKETDTTDVIFSATPLIGYTGNDKVFPAIYKLNNGVEQMVEHNIRIMQAKKITGRSTWFIKAANGSNLSTGLTTYGYAGHLNDWISPTSDFNFGVPKEVYFNADPDGFSNNLFNTYYSPYFAEITDKDSRLVTCKMKLNEKDIFNLDFGRFVWVDGVLYRLVKIVDYSADDVCEVQLLRAINTTY